MFDIREANHHAGGITAWDSSSAFVIKSLLHPLVAVGCLALALVICDVPFRNSYFLIGVLAFLGTADLLDSAPLGDRGAKAQSAQGLIAVLSRWLVIVGGIWLLISLSGLDAHFDTRVVLTWAIITPPILWLSRLIAQRLLQVTAMSEKSPRNAVIIGINNVGQLLHRRLQEDVSLGIRVLGYFEDERAQTTEATPAVQRLGDPSQLREYILKNDVHIVYITWPMAREARILELLETLRESTVSIYFVPDISIVNLIQGRVDIVNGIPVVGVCESPFYGIRGLAKRIFDIVVAGTLLILTAPLFAAIAIGVKMSSPGPIIFRQKRYGLDGKEITVYKFRSMTVMEDGATEYRTATRNDSRVTPFGAFIRRTSLDELPQLLNVLEGSMSMVGPRPLVIATNERYRRQLSGYMVRHKVKPGITGWAQINGARGGDDLESMRRRLHLDLEYLQNWSLGFDISIILKTIKLVWADRHAY